MYSSIILWLSFRRKNNWRETVIYKKKFSIMLKKYLYFYFLRLKLNSISWPINFRFDWKNKISSSTLQTFFLSYLECKTIEADVFSQKKDYGYLVLSQINCFITNCCSSLFFEKWNAMIYSKIIKKHLNKISILLKLLAIVFLL